MQVKICLFRGCQVLEDGTLVADVTSKSKSNSTKHIIDQSFSPSEIQGTWLTKLEEIRLASLSAPQFDSDSDEEGVTEKWLPFKVTDKERVLSKPKALKRVAKNVIKPLLPTWVPKIGKTYSIVMVEEREAGHSGTKKGGSCCTAKSMLNIAVLSTVKKYQRYVLTHDTIDSAHAGLWSVVKFVVGLSVDEKKLAIEEAYVTAASKIRVNETVDGNSVQYFNKL